MLETGPEAVRPIDIGDVAIAVARLQNSSVRLEKLTKWLIALTAMLAFLTAVLVGRTFI